MKVIEARPFCLKVHLFALMVQVCEVAVWFTVFTCPFAPILLLLLRCSIEKYRQFDNEKWKSFYFPILWKQKRTYGAMKISGWRRRRWQAAFKCFSWKAAGPFTALSFPASTFLAFWEKQNGISGRSGAVHTPVAFKRRRLENVAHFELRPSPGNGGEEGEEELKAAVDVGEDPVSAKKIYFPPAIISRVCHTLHA